MILRVLEWIWTLQAAIGGGFVGYLLRSDILTRRWLKAEKINSYLAFTTKLDTLRHSIVATLLTILFIVGVISLLAPVSPGNINSRSVSVSIAFVLAEWLIVAACLIDVLTTHRLLNYHGLKRS